MIYDIIAMEDLVPKVTEYAQMGYSPERIADLLRLSAERRRAFIIRISSPDDTLNIAYRESLADAEYSIDCKLADKANDGDIDSIKALAERNNERNVLELRKELFGV